MGLTRRRDEVQRISGSVKLRCDLGSGWSDGGAAGLPGFLRPSAWRCCSFSASMRRSSTAASLASASSACWIFASRFCLSPEQRLFGQAPSRPTVGGTVNRLAAARVQTFFGTTAINLSHPEEIESESSLTRQRTYEIKMHKNIFCAQQMRKRNRCYHSSWESELNAPLLNSARCAESSADQFLRESQHPRG
jgi:hypothetical protein